MLRHLLLFLLWKSLFHLISADHYKGGTISWKPTNPSAISGPTVDIIITERQSWTFSRYPCNETIIDTFNVYNDTQGDTPATLACISDIATCTASLYQTINAPLFCTDFSTVFQITSGTYYTTRTLAINSIIDVAWRGTAWTDEILTNAFSLVTHIDLTPISGKINTSPVTGSLPIIQTYVGITKDIQIMVDDVDYDQTFRCRWSLQEPLDECGDVCLNLPNAKLNPIDCVITWTPVLRSKDIAKGLNSSTYVIAITVEDFVDTTSTTPLSSVPHQMLVYVTTRPPNACVFAPSVYAFPRRNLGCYGVSVGSINTYNFQGSISTSCPNDTIVDFISSSPLFTNRSALYRVSNYTWAVNIRWTANSNQTGLQPFCVAAVDNHGQTSSPACVMIMVGSTNPGLYTPSFVQGTASPVGTVMATQTMFSIQATLPLTRTRLNGTFITIYRLTGGQVYQIDCRYSPDVYFVNKTLTFYVRSPPWVLGVTYYITMTDGVATAANLYCETEAGGFGGNNVRRFTIWNPAASSTLTPPTTTTTATTHTVTTRVMNTTTYNTLYTTTGIPAYTTTTMTTTTSTTSTSATTTTTTSATTTTTTTTTTTKYIPNADVMYPKDLERACLQPIAIAAALVTAAMIPLHFYALINLFVKMNANFQQEILRARIARRIRLQDDVNYSEEEHETLV